MLPHAPDCNHTDGTATAGIVAASPATNATAATLSSIPVARDSVSSSITDRDTNNKNESRSDLGVVFDHATVLATVAVPLPASYTKYTMGALRRCRYGLQRCLLSSACLPCRPQRSSQVATQNQRTTGDEPACAALSPHKWRAMIAGGGGGGQVPIEMRWVRNSSTTTPSSSSSPSSSPTDSGPPLRTANDARNGKKAQKQQPSFGEASPDKSTDKPRMATWGRVALVTRPLLHDMTLRFPHGKLSVIFGATGSGKSVLLASLLAGHLSTVRAGDDGTKAAIGGADDEERDSESGATTAAGMRIDARTCTDATEPQISPVQLLLPPGSRLAYVPQVPWIMHASIKRNITLWNDEPHCDRTNGTMEDDGANDSTCYYQSGKNDGATVEDVDERMERAMACCQLTNDVRDLRDGVETEVGEKGINLSGGQKARLSLARAVYADCAVYLLDDPLSALDAHVGARVMQECVVQALSHTTRLLVTHQIHLALPSADYVVVMHEGRVVFAGEPQDYARSPWCERVETTKRQADAQRRRQMSTSAAHDGTTKREKDTNNNANKDQTKDWSGSESEESEMNLDEAMRTRTQSTIIPITHSNEGRSAQTSHTDQVRSCAADKKDANDTASHANTAAAVTHKSSSAGAMGRVATQPSKSLAGEADSGDEDGTDNDREESAESSEPSCVQMHTQLMEEEEKAMGHVPWHVYLRYAAAGAGVRLAPDSTSSSSSAAVSASGMCHPSDYSVAGSADASSETTESDRPDRGNTTSHAIAKVFSEDALTEQAGHDSPANNDNNNNNNKHKQNGDNGDTQATLPAPCYATFRALLYFFSIFFFFLLCEGLAACSSLWLTGWAVDFLPFLSAKYYLLVYVLMNLTECVMAFANSLLCYRFARHAGRTLHRDLLLTLASATIGFFDRTPQGRMVNRFSTDVNVMDNELPRNGMIVMRLICFFISTMALSIYGTPPVAAVFALAAVVFVILLRYYSRVIREVRRRGSVAQSPLFSLLEDVMSGRPTLRAYGVIHRVFDRALRDLDVVYSYKYLEHAVDHWMLLRLQYLGSVTMVTVCCVGFAEKYISSESDMSVVRVGLISLSLTMCNDMNWLLPAIVHLAAQSDANMNSVQRIVHYIDTVEQETLFLRSTLEEELQRKKQKDAETAGRRRVGSLALCGASSCCGSQSSVITKTAATSCAPHASILAHKEQHGQSSLDELAASPMTTFTTVTTTATTATTPANASVQAGSVQYIRVNMRYRPCLPLVLRRVSFAIHPGERIGVVGRTGSGKSTLLLTLLRLVDVCDGTILVCGQPIRHYTLPRLRQLFSFIPQDPLLFHGTVRSNLDPFGVYRSDVAIWEALEHVGMAAHFRENQPGKDKNSNNATATATNKHSVAVHALPSEHAEETSDQPVAGLSRHNSAHRIANYSMADNSLGNNSIFSNHSLVASHSRIVTITSTVNDANDTAMQSTDKFDANSNAQTASGLDSPVLEGGSNFSVGQRQLLCLARALLKQGSRFLLMDEATANIDAKHDRRVQDVVQNHFKAYTIITIAHRLHTVAAYDRVLVMDHGRLVEQGSPRELVQNPQSLFHAMVARAGRSRKDEAANAQRESATNLATPEHTRCGEENEALQGARAAAGSNQEAVRRFLSMCK